MVFNVLVVCFLYIEAGPIACNGLQVGRLMKKKTRIVDLTCLEAYDFLVVTTIHHEILKLLAEALQSVLTLQLASLD